MQRREFLGSLGGLPLSIAASRFPVLATASPQPKGALAKAFAGRKTNVVILMTDQQRTTAFLPPAWAQSSLRSFDRLRENGIEFTNAFTTTCQCTPSRATFLTSCYPAQHGVTTTFSAPSADTVDFETPNNPLGGPRTLPTNMTNLAHVLAVAGYDVVYKGKWHESQPVIYPGKQSPFWSARDIGHMRDAWGFEGWTPPDAGNSLSDVTTFGGGFAQNDSRFIYGPNGPQSKANGKARATPGWGQGVLEFLERRRPEDRPFCLLVNLVNPHDVVGYPKYARQGGYNLEMILGEPDLDWVKAPSSMRETLKDKPSVQRILRDHWNAAHPLAATEDQVGYLQFYLHLQQEVDGHIMKLLDVIEQSWLSDKTLVIRLADHGEMGLAHGGLRGKEYTAYEEAIRIPMIFSSKALWSQAQATDAFAALIDIVPTLAELTGVSEQFQGAFQGRSLVPALSDRKAAIQNEIHFTYDDVFLPDLEVPGHIRSIRTRDHKYSVYFNPGYVPGRTRLEYELYQYKGDPLGETEEVHNLATGRVRAKTRRAWKSLHGRLTSAMRTYGTTPQTIAWPTADEATKSVEGCWRGADLGMDPC